jgi:hypothetical protein
MGRAYRFQLKVKAVARELARADSYTPDLHAAIVDAHASDSLFHEEQNGELTELMFRAAALPPPAMTKDQMRGLAGVLARRDPRRTQRVFLEKLPSTDVRVAYEGLSGLAAMTESMIDSLKVELYDAAAWKAIARESERLSQADLPQPLLVLDVGDRLTEIVLSLRGSWLRRDLATPLPLALSDEDRARCRGVLERALAGKKPTGGWDPREAALKILTTGGVATLAP